MPVLCLRLIVYTPDADKYLPLINTVESEPEFWGDGPMPPRTLVVSGLHQNDIVEVQGDFMSRSG